MAMFKVPGQPEENEGVKDVGNQLDEIQLQLDRIESQIAILVDIGKRLTKIEETLSSVQSTSDAASH